MNYFHFVNNTTGMYTQNTPITSNYKQLQVQNYKILFDQLK